MSDLISRQAAIDAINKYACNTQRIYEAIKTLPSVQPERKTGNQLPSAQPDACENTCEIERKSNDTISRQQAIDALRKDIMGGLNYESIIKNLPSAQPYTEAEIQKMQDLEQAELDKAFECGRESAQLEIVRCKDCKHHSHDAGYGYDWCNRTSGVFRVKPEDFCSRAERRT